MAADLPSGPDDERASHPASFERSPDDFRLLLDSIRDHAVIMLDPGGDILTWTEGARQIHGFDAEDVVHRSFKHLYRPVDVESGKPEQDLRLALANGSHHQEAWRVREDGVAFWASVDLTAMRAPDGALVGFGQVTRDLTERMEAEDRYRLLVDSVRDYAIFLLDPGGKIMSWNTGAERIKGHTREETLGKSFTMFYTQEDVASGHPARELAIAASTGRYEEEGFRIRKDGTRFWANVVLTRLQGPEGQVIGFSKVTRDLTERRLAELSLRDSEERFRLMVEGVRDTAMLMLDPSGHITSWNVGAERIKGWRASEIIGRHFSVFYPPEDVKSGKPEHELLVAQREGRLEDFGWRVRKDGSRFFASVVITALRGGEPDRLRGFSKVTRDLTEQRQAEENVHRAHAELERRVEERTRALTAANSELDAFSHSVSHDLRAPLRAIDGFAKLLATRLGEGIHADVRSYVTRIREGSQRMSRLIDDMLSLSQLGRATMARQRVDMRAAALAVVAELERAEPDRRVEIVVADLPPAHADPGLISVVWQNLLGNAWKYGAGHARTRIEVGASPRGEITVYWVKDDGAGFDMAYVGKLFGAFQRLHSAAEFSGTGIGLATVRRIVRRHGGDVWAQGEVEKGATFYFTLEGGNDIDLAWRRSADVEPSDPRAQERAS